MQHDYKALYGKDITAKDAVLIALDTSKATALAKDIPVHDQRRLAQLVYLRN